MSSAWRKTAGALRSVGTLRGATKHPAAGPTWALRVTANFGDSVRLGHDASRSSKTACGLRRDSEVASTGRHDLFILRRSARRPIRILPFPAAAHLILDMTFNNRSRGPGMRITPGRRGRERQCAPASLLGVVTPAP